MAVTSILNSVAANTALLNLENTIGSLNNVQSQISTGLKVQSAADNAAYYSISSVLNSDSSALSSVSDLLNLGNSSLSVASNAISQIQTTLNDIKSKLVEATQPNANMATIQAVDLSRSASAAEHLKLRELQWTELPVRELERSKL